MQRWFVDGTVKCYGDWGHTILAVTAILVLALLAAWIPLICVLTICDRIRNKSDVSKVELNVNSHYPVLQNHLLLNVARKAPG